MRFIQFVVIVVLAAEASACSRAAAQSVMLEPLFKSAVPNDTISGRAAVDDGRVLLMSGGTALAMLDLANRTGTLVPLRIPEPRCWGLARLSDGSMWTLQNRRSLIELKPDGTSDRTISLDRAHLGVFASGDQLILQPAAMEADVPALRARRVDAAEHTPWGDIKTRAFPGLHQGAMMALNMVSCGIGLREELPCWFPDEPTVFMVAHDGRTRRIPLAGLPRVIPEVLLTSEAPPRPIRDGYVDPSGTIWILSSGNRARPSGSAAGGVIVARFGPHGEPIDSRELAEPVRLILRAQGGRAVVLTSRGVVAELLP